MLKWAVNGSKQSYLSSNIGDGEVIDKKYVNNRAATRRSLNSIIDCTEAAQSSNAKRRRLRRKSSEICSLRHKLQSQNKENQLTSTPLPQSVRRHYNDTPLRKLDSLKDLSNITSEDIHVESPHKCTPLDRAAGLQTPEIQTSRRKSIPANYASTLPTFDVEYSPCGVVPGPVLALRGVGIADTYFEKPRYLTQEFQELNRRDGSKPDALPSVQKAEHVKPCGAEEESSLSSSRMGDMTLERMIDAILESARKERKVLKFSKHLNCPRVMSPTYTRADDPASDLQEFWDASDKPYQQGARIALNPASAIPNVANAFNEREVCSPLTEANGQQRHKTQQQNNAFRLRRQKPVRRKRKFRAFAEAESAAQKILARELDALNYDLVSQRQMDADKQVRNISPDSGRNSFSDYEDSTLESSSGAVGSVENKSSGLNTTKRRLSFSFNDLGEF